MISRTMDEDTLDQVRGRLIERRAVPSIFLIDRNSELQSSTPGSSPSWTELAPTVLSVMRAHRYALEQGEPITTIADRRFLVRIRRLDGDAAAYVVICESFRTRDPLRDVGERYTLTRREREVARLLIGGAGTAEIAEALCISTATVVLHVKSIMAKTGTRSRTAVVGRIVHHDGDAVS